MHLERVAEAIAHGLPIKPGSSLLIPAWEGGHQDHDAAHLIGRRLADRTGARAWQFPLYTGSALTGLRKN